jgi:rhodanese-related sulfurtransferase
VSTPADPKRGFARGLVVEASFLVAAGLIFSLAANALSPRGLSLARDYFKLSAPLGTPARATNTSVSAPATAAPEDEVGKRIQERGLAVIDRAGVETLFHDPQYEQEAIIFIDARDDRHYEQGHIPGAYQFDRYYPERYLPVVLPACQNASRIVVYCTGGKCEDSEFAAGALVEAGIPADRIAVYIGGIADWTELKRPIELGPRKSGLLKEQSQ